MAKQKSNTGLFVILIVCGIIIGAVGAVLAMNIFNRNRNTLAESKQETMSDIVEETKTVFSDDELEAKEELDLAVIKVNDAEITMKEVNIYTYQLRDFYTAQYGESPWETTMEDGTLLRDYAKEELKAGMVRTEILINKADDYEVALTDEEKQTCAEEAKAYIDSIGPVICDNFALTVEGDTLVREKEMLSTKVYNAALERLAETEEDTSEVALAQAFEDLYATWEAEYTVTEEPLWANIILGSVG